ncbi:MAG: hypothetical protein DF168_01154 [Candidatus Moanabacter tarae]|uniref:Uncharacterized protein n=1 Tax=Candidatus Moanibacter tarae TaxID=2200854 RepID=A0A2Z4AG10_9BACT|nr:MAG: hypothetical protein DF168_01154 [Candidatus Moanabacter tarae]
MIDYHSLEIPNQEISLVGLGVNSPTSVTGVSLPQNQQNKLIGTSESDI